MSKLAKGLRFILAPAVCYGAVFMEAGSELIGDADQFYVIITSDPQYPFTRHNDPRLDRYDDNVGKLSEALIVSQYRSIQSLKATLKSEDPDTPLRGVIINGDLTAFGHGDELGKMKELWKNQLEDTHIFMGLGNHDYENNVNDCHGNNCANRMYDFMVDHRDSGGQLTTEMELLTSIWYRAGLNWYQTPDYDQTGPLWYSFRLGGRASTGDDRRVSRLPGVRFIQLQNYANYTKTWNEGRDNEINIQPDWIWLENQLAWARWYGESIVFLGHCGAYTKDVARMARQYGVAAAFSGHYHEELGQSSAPFWWSSTTPLFKSGSSIFGTGVTLSDGREADGGYLLVKFTLNRTYPMMDVWRVGNFLDTVAPLRRHEGQYPLYPVRYKDADNLPAPWMMGKAYDLDGSYPVSSGRTLVENDSYKRIRVRECSSCNNGAVYSGDWIELLPGERREFNVGSTTGFAAHGYHIEHQPVHTDETDKWEALDHPNPSFSYVAKERCVSVVEHKWNSIITGNPTNIVGWGVECDYYSHKNRAPYFYQSTYTLSVAENSATGTLVGTLRAGDEDRDPVEYSLDSTLDALFAIDADGNIIVRHRGTGWLDHEGEPEYSGKATAHDGLTSASVAVTITVTDVDEPPDAPDAPTVAATSGSSVKVTWTLPDTSRRPPVTDYDVQYRESGADRWTDATVDGTATNVDIDALTVSRYTTYEAQVRATNDEGRSAWSEVGTSLEPAPGRPGKPTVAAASRTSVHVSWTAPDMTGKPPLTGYDVQFRPSGAETWDRLFGHGWSSPVVLNELVPGTVYEVQVRAWNDVGAGGYSATGRGPTDANSPPVFEGQPASLSVAEGSGDGTLVGTVEATDADGDVLEYSLDHASALAFDIDADGDITVRAGAVLDPDSKAAYDATVTASDPWDSASHVVTIRVGGLNEPPGAPGVPTVAGASRTSVTVTWTPPDTRGRSPVADYDVQYRVSGESAWTDALFEGTHTTATIGGLAGTTEYEAQVQATSDKGTGSWSATGKGSTLANSPPVFPEEESARTFSVPENSADGTLVGIVEATDIDGDLLTYSIDPIRARPFEVSSTGAITVWNGAVLDHELEPGSYTLDPLMADDGFGGTATTTLSINVTDELEPPDAPEAPTVAGASRTSVAVSWTAPDATGRPPVTDYDVRYRASGADGWSDAEFAGTDTTATVGDLNPGTAYEAQVQAVSEEGRSPWSATGSGSTHANSAPSFAGRPATLDVAENSGGGTAVGTVAAADADGDTLEYSLDGVAAAVFDIDADGDITVRADAALDHEAKAEYSATVTADDGFDRTDHGVAIRVSDVDEPPDAPEAPTVAGASRTSVAVSWTAPDATGRPPVTDYDVRYRASGADGWSDAEFAGTDTTATVGDLNPGTAYEAQVQAVSEEGRSPWSATGSGSTHANSAPSFAGRPATLDVAENSGGGTAVGTVAAADADGDTLEYSLDGVAAAVFDIDADGDITVRADAALDHEAKAEYSATVTADDGFDRTDHGVAIRVSDVDEPPDAPEAPTVAGASRTSVAVSWTAPDATGRPPVTDYDVRYRASGADGWSDAEFAGTDTTATVGDLNPGTAYEAQVQAVSEEGRSPWSATGSGSTHANSAPSFAGRPATLDVAENSGGGTAVGTVAAADADGDTLEYSLDGVAAAVFDIDADGDITVRADAALDHEAKAEYSATVTADDGFDRTDHGVAIRVSDVDEPPDAPEAPTVAGASRTSVAVSWTAPDATGRPPVTDYDVRYRASGADGWSDAEFAGTDTTATVGDLNPGTAYEAQVQAVSEEGRSPWSATGSGSTHANSAPSFAGRPATLDVAENSGGGTAVGTVAAADADGDTLEYSLDGVAAAVFDIDADGDITVRADAALDHEAKAEYSATVTADDGFDRTDHGVAIRVSDVDEPPGAPGAPTVAGASDTSVAVVWTAPDTAGRPPVTDYDVRYRASGADGWTDAPFDGTDTEATIGDLNPGTAYEAQVQARNAEGSGPWSATGGGESLASLTAEFVDLPADHDGRRLFRFELRFSEEFEETPRLRARLRDEALRATNGTVTQADRVEPGKNRRWTIGVRPDTYEDVTVDLPATTDCDAADAVCAADGRALSNSLSATVAGPPPLTAEFVDVPAEHELRLFRFELRFSEEFEETPGLRARLRDEALRATNGTVTQADRVEPGKNRRWTIGVRPDSHEDVTVELPATTDCDASDAVCASDGRPLSNSLSATVEGPPPLTAEFVDVPAEHDGSLFRFELRFSEEFKGPAGMLARLRDKALRATNGTVEQAKRVEPGKNRRWTIGVEPDSHEDVTVELPATTDCDAADAICTKAGRPLSNSLSATVDGPSASNAMAATLDLLQGPLAARLSRDEDPVQPLPLVASRPTMAVGAVRTGTSASIPDVLLRVTAGSDVFDIDADFSATSKEAVEGTDSDASEAFRSVLYLAEVPATLVRRDATLSVVVDPDNVLAETDETDNELAVPLADLRVVQPPAFRVRLVPITRVGARPLEADDGHESMLAETLALLPIGRHRVESAPPLVVDSGASPRRMLDRLFAAWNRDADPDEFYHGLYRAEQHWPEGLALVGGRVAVSPVAEDGAPHDSGRLVANGVAHNFGLGGDTVADAMATYGWSSASERFFSPLDREIMDTSGGPALFISRANYERALAWMYGSGIATMPAAGSEPATAPGSIALTGGIDASGQWYLHSAERSRKPPRDAFEGEYSAVVYDETGVAGLQRPLRILPLSAGAGGAWALRVPITPESAHALRIRDRDGDLLLDVELVFAKTPPDPHAARPSPQ